MFVGNADNAYGSRVRIEILKACYICNIKNTSLKI